MKPLLQKLTVSKDSSYLFERFESPFFETPLHFHEEFEIVLCDGGYGKKVIGYHTSEYFEDDLILIGSNLPHWFRAEDVFYQNNSPKKPASIVIQFRIDSFGEHFFDLTEMKKIQVLFENAKNGVAFKGETKERINTIIRGNIQKTGIQKFLILIEILEIMAQSKEAYLLSEVGMQGLSYKDSARMNIVFDQLFKHFKEEITIEQMAEKINLSKAAFCRYFKARTQKTFIEYLNAVRLNHACKLLQETEMDIFEICFESGFNNLSNFNRMFKKTFLTNPKTYRKRILT